MDEDFLDALLDAVTETRLKLLTEDEARAVRPVRRTVAIHSFPRYRQDRSVVVSSTAEERRARQRLRAQVDCSCGW